MLRNVKEDVSTHPPYATYVKEEEALVREEELNGKSEFYVFSYG